MSRPPVPYPDRAVALPPMLFPPAAYYALLGAFGRAVIAYDGRYDKRYKAIRRYEIADTRGRLALTVPVTVPHGLDRPLRRSDVRLSRHGEWWRLHRTALESAYGRTPYFEFVADRFLDLLADPGEGPQALSPVDLARRANSAVCRFLGIETEITESPAPEAVETLDLTGADFSGATLPPYRQIRADSIGFHPGLSILDLIFNLGPEAQIYLSKAQRLYSSTDNWLPKKLTKHSQS